MHHLSRRSQRNNFLLRGFDAGAVIVDFTAELEAGKVIGGATEVAAEADGDFRGDPGAVVDDLTEGSQTYFNRTFPSSLCVLRELCPSTPLRALSLSKGG